MTSFHMHLQPCRPITLHLAHLLSLGNERKCADDGCENHKKRVFRVQYWARFVLYG